MKNIVKNMDYMITNFLKKPILTKRGGTHLHTTKMINNLNMSTRLLLGKTITCGSKVLF